MAGCDTSTNGVENTHRPSFGSEGALRGLGSNPAAEELPSGRLGRGRRQNPHLHRLQGRGRCARPAARMPRMWPRGSSPASALWQDLKRALRGLRPSSWRLVISTFPKLSIPPGCICVRVGGEDRGRSPGDSRRSGVHGAEGRERAKSYLVSQSRISVAVGCLVVVSYMYGQCPASQKSTW